MSNGNVMRRRIVTAVAAGFVGAVAARPAYPDRVIKIVVPFAPGGGVDAIARLLAQALAERLSQAVIVENRAGGSTTIGTNVVARAAPDGYTVLMASSSLTTAPSLYRSITFDPQRDFSAVAMVANSPAVLATRHDSRFDSLQSLIAAARARPGELTCANYGNGSTPHLVSELFQQLTGTKLLAVPYGGGGPAVLSTLSGETDVVFPTALPVLSQYKAGRLKLLAIASKQRSPLLPNVPTFAEQGVALEAGTWFGVLAPAGTPSAVVNRLHDEINAISTTAIFRKRLEDEGADVEPMSVGDFADFLKRDQQRWSRVIATAHIVAE